MARGQMFGGVDLALDAQNLLRARDADVVDELLPEVREAGAIARAGKLRHPGAARAAVQIHAEPRAEAPQRGEVRGQDLIEIGIAFEDFAEAVLHEDGDVEVRAEAFQNVERGCGEDAIAQAPEPEDGDPAAPRQTFQNAVHGLFFDLRLVDQHDRDVVADRVYAMALDALQAALVGLEFDRRLAHGAHEDFEQIFADSHSESSV